MPGAIMDLLPDREARTVVGETIARQERRNGRACHCQHPSIEISSVADSDCLGCDKRSFRVERGRTAMLRSAPASQSERGAVASPPPAAGNSPTIVEWLNQTVHLRDTVQALDRPSSDGKATGRIRGGAEVKAIGIVAGREWVQIELPDQVLAYIPVGAVELNESTAASSPGQKAEPAAAPMPGATSPEPASTAAIVQGPVTRVPNAATLVVGDQRIRLSGVDPGPPTVLAPFENWMRAQGALSCEPEAQTGRYRCFTSGGVDVAEAAIFNGAGRVGDGATPGYRERETEARQAHRGLWQGP